MDVSTDLKIPDVFMDLLEPYRYKAFEGGRGSAKSMSFAKVLLATGTWKPLRILCAREIQKSITESVKQLLDDEITAMGFTDYYTSTKNEIRGINGTKFLFHGLGTLTVDQIKSFQGLDRVWIEEAQTVSAHSLEILIPTIREEGSELWFSWNPTSRLDPIDKMLRRYTPGDAIIVEANHRDNPWFPESLKADMARDREQDPEKAAHIWDGEYSSVTGGSYYAALLADSRRAGRITSVEYEPEIPVYTAWDLGIGDSMSIWLWQQTPESIRVIDHYENHSQPIPHYVKWLEAQPYAGNYSTDWVPHDARVRELGTGLTRVETLKKLKRKPRVVPNHKIDDGINALRELLPIMWFDAEKCEYGLECLMQYREDYDEKLLTLKSRPLKDWTAHTSDSARYMAMAYREMKPDDDKPGPLKFDMSLTQPPTLDELWNEHEKTEIGKNW